MTVQKPDVPQPASIGSGQQGELQPAERFLKQLSEVQLAQLPIYRDPLEHAREELRRLAMVLDLRRVVAQREREARKSAKVDGGAGLERFKGLLLRDGDFGDLVQRASGLRPQVESPELKRRIGAIEGLTRRIHLREAATLWSVGKGAGGCRLPLLEVAQGFGLNRFAYQVLVMALAPEVELAFQRIFAHLHNDVTRKRPTVNLALEVFGRSDSGRREGRRVFASSATLRRYNLLHLEGESAGLEKSLLLREFKMPERMVQWLLGARELDPAMDTFCQLEPTEGRTLDGLIYDVTIQRRLASMAAYLGRPEVSKDAATPLVVLTGPAGVGKRSVTRALASAVERPLLTVDLAATAIPLSQRDRAFRDMAREARLHGAALCLANYSEALVEGRISPPLSYLYSVVRLAPGLGVVTSLSEEVGLGGAGRGFSTRLGLEVPETPDRMRLWRAMLDATAGVKLHEGLDLRQFALKYGFTAGTIERVLRYAAEEASVRSGQSGALVESADLDRACRIQLGQGLSGVATRVRRRASWEDLILPEEIVEVLHEILRHARMRTQVFHEWGFDRKMTSGKGLSVLFSGPPGTGKTMVAGVIASMLDMDLYKVDLSQIVSKYVGETEKNLNKVFQAAAANQFIILFDEADSLFSKRTEVKSSVDRYANLEVNYLLQKMEEYSGICVLTTNFEKSIDDAFKRRLNFRVDFPFPEAEDRARLWRVHIPTEAPVESDLELDWLAEKYELSGGNIKNAVLRAAFRAAAGERPINIEDLEYAAERESRELGKLVQDVGY